MTTQSTSGAPASLTIVTCNVRYGTASDGPNHWENRRELLCRTLVDLQPDVLALQEPLSDQLTAIGAAFPGYRRLGVGRIDGQTDGEWAAIFVRESRLDVVESGTFWLSETPDVPGSRGWDVAYHPRICTWAVLRDRASGRRFRVLNSHWDNEGKVARLHSAGMIAAKLAESSPPLPALVMGDFNDTPDSPALCYLTGVDTGFPAETAGSVSYPPAPRLADSGAARAADRGTFHGFSGKTDGERIDYVLLTPDIVLEDYQIVSASENGRFPSDHFPVAVRVRLAETMP